MARLTDSQNPVALTAAAVVYFMSHRTQSPPVAGVSKGIRHDRGTRLRLIAGAFVVLSVLLGMSASANFRWFTLFVGANLFQSAFTNSVSADGRCRRAQRVRRRNIQARPPAIIRVEVNGSGTLAGVLVTAPPSSSTPATATTGGNFSLPRGNLRPSPGPDQRNYAFPKHS